VADLSQGFEETWAFLERRMADVVDAENSLSEMTQASAHAARSTNFV